MERCTPISINPEYAEDLDNDDIVMLEPKREPNIKTDQIQAQICRLCLSEISGPEHNKLEGITKNMLEIIIPELNTSVCSSSAICSNCDKTLQQIYNFKSSCLEIEDKIQEFANPTSPADLTLEEIICQKELAENGIHSEIGDSERMCRTCLSVVDGKICTDLYNFDGDPLKDMLEKCIPEMIINLTKEPVICPVCLESLEDQFHFLMQCLDSEEKINYYKEKVKCNDNIDLYSVFIFSTQVEEDQQQPNSEIDKEKTVAILDFEKEKAEEIINIDKETTGEILETDKHYEKKEISAKDNDNEVEIPEIITQKDDESEIQQINTDTIIDLDVEGEVYSLSSDGESDDTEDSDSLLSVTNVVDVNEDKLEEEKKVKSRTGFKGKEDAVVVHDQPIYKEDELSDEETYRPFNKRRRAFKCPKCSYKFRYKAFLTSHLEKHHKNGAQNLFKCKDSNCNFSTTDKPELKKHLKTSHPNLIEKPTYPCPNCTETFIRKGNLDKHVLICTNDSKKKEKKELKWRPNYGTKTCYRFDRHMLTMYKCKICPYQTRKKGNFDRHSQIHNKSNDIKIHKCTECSFQTVKKDSFTAHMQSHSSPSNGLPLRKCFLCSYETKRIDYFKKHMLVHKTESKDLV